MPEQPVKLTEDEPWADFAAGDRRCHGCGLICLPEDHPVTSRDGGHYKHFTCWYDDVIPARLTDAGREVLNDAD